MTTEDDPVSTVAALARKLARQDQPLDRVATLAAIQRATGPAIVAAVDDARSTGNGWALICAVLGMPRSTVARNMAAGSITVPAAPAGEVRSA